MSTVAEIESAIEQLPPEEFRALQDWMTRRAAQKPGREWTPEEVVEAAQRMIDEPDRAKSDAIKQELMKGFYGIADA